MDTPQSAPSKGETLAVPVEEPGTSPAAESPNSESGTEVLPCPRCNGKLVNPQGLGWCPKCGYCRSLLENSPAALAEGKVGAHPPSPLGMVEFYEMLTNLPRWLRVLLGGAAILAVVSTAAHFVLPRQSLVRAVWSTLQLMLAFIGLLAAQAWALFRIAPEEASLGPKDFFITATLWTFACKRLPSTQKQVWLGGWSLTAGLCAVFLVGGFSYWAQFYKPKKLASKDLVGAANSDGEGKDKSMQESIEDFANTQDLTKKKDGQDDKDDPKVDNRPTVQCVVIGYLIEGKELSGLVLATLQDDKLKYSGVVKKGFSEEDNKEILQQLATLVRPTPLIKGLNLPAIWVKPEVFCEVHASGSDRKTGELVNPNFSSLLRKG